MIEKKHTIWVEKYRPKNIEEYLGIEENKSKFSKFIEDQDIPHLMFIGKPGSGKTSLAKILANNINCDYLLINATDERGMDVIREKIGGFASSSSFKPLKMVILDEATHLLEASQVLLLNMIETYSLKTRFILTGNFIERLIPPLRSRCQEFDLEAPAKGKVAEHLDFILNQENVNYQIEDLKIIINRFYPDLRKIINNCQKYTINNSLVLNKEFLDSENYCNDILKELKQPKVEFKKIRQIVANSELSEFTEVYKFLFSKVDDFSRGNEGEVILVLSEMNYQANFMTDKELNISAALYKIVEIISKKKVL
jgi:DNA polymerase III delta prime subunit